MNLGPSARCRKFVLRHSVEPYVSMSIIFLGFAVWGLVLGLRSKHWGAFQSALLLCAVYSPMVAIGLWYRITLNDGVITQRAFRMPAVSIAIGEITSVGNEVSDPATVAKMNRPLRRICINAGNKGARKTIDISLKHFWKRDIRTLMAAIHQARPDLALPKDWA
jgi:hypothetical protein